MLKCAFCGRRLEPTVAWKGHGERYYCNEFCADEAFSPKLNNRTGHSWLGAFHLPSTFESVHDRF
jgi:hypothetical protein